MVEQLDQQRTRVERLVLEQREQHLERAQLVEAHCRTLRAARYELEHQLDHVLSQTERHLGRWR